MAYVNPTSKTSLSNGSHKNALAATTKRYQEKMATHRKQAGEAGADGLAFEKKPLVLGVTGGMAGETQKWWETMPALGKTATG